MPVWLETTTLMLAAYGLGLALGWLLWGRAAIQPEADKQEKDIP